MDIKRTQSFKNKKILITAGPTWVALDGVRVISNIASGLTGILLAHGLRRLGARVTLVLGPGDCCCIDKNITVVRFRFFDELKAALTRLLRKERFDIAIHSAAVSDFRPANVRKGKIGSSVGALTVTLVPTEKLVKLFKRIQPKLTLAIFKLELGLTTAALIKKARAAQRQYGAEIAVANTFVKDEHVVYIIDHDGSIIPACGKQDLAGKLIQLLVTSY